MNGEFEKYFKRHSRKLTGGRDWGKHRLAQSGIPVSQPKFEPSASRMQVRSVADSPKDSGCSGQYSKCAPPQYEYVTNYRFFRLAQWWLCLMFIWELNSREQRIPSFIDICSVVSEIYQINKWARPPHNGSILPVDETSLRKERGNFCLLHVETMIRLRLRPGQIEPCGQAVPWSLSYIAILPKSRTAAPRPLYTVELEAYFPVFFSLILAAAARRG